MSHLPHALSDAAPDGVPALIGNPASPVAAVAPSQAAPSQIVLPSQALALLVRQGTTGCLRLRGLQASDPQWSVHLGQGQIHFIGGLGPERDRMAYLLQRTGMRLPLPQTPQASLYGALQRGWKTGRLGLPQLRELIQLCSQEALLHLLALPQAEAQLERTIGLDPIVMALSLKALTQPIEEQVGQWQQLRRRLPSPYHRLSLVKPAAFCQAVEPALRALMRRQTQVPPSAVLALEPSLYRFAAQLNADLLPLALCLAPAIRRGELRVLPPSQEMVPAAAQLTIAVVDDDPAIQAQVEQVLSAAGYRVVTIGRSPQTLSQLMQAQPALILMDVDLAMADGQALAQLLRRSPLLRHRPVVWMDSREGLGELVMKLKAKASGGLIRLSKPLVPQQLLKAVADHAIVPSATGRLT